MDFSFIKYTIITFLVEIKIKSLKIDFMFKLIIISDDKNLFC